MSKYQNFEAMKVDFESITDNWIENYILCNISCNWGKLES
jgi:hypothetical protein